MTTIAVDRIDGLATYDDVMQGTEEWLALRRGIVTASTVGNLITVGVLGAIGYDCPTCGAAVNSPCMSRVRKDPTPISTMHQERTAIAVERRDDSPPVLTVANNDTSRGLTMLLVSERITGWTEPGYQSFDMLRGTLDEPVARAAYAQHYAQKNDVEVTELGFMDRLVYGYRLGYSPDGLVGDDGLIEIKSRRPKTQVSTVLADQVPPENMAQIQAGLLVSGRDWCDYVSFAGGMHLWTKRVYPDPDWFAAITESVLQFEEYAELWIARYTEAVEGLPMTERNIIDETAGITF